MMNDWDSIIQSAWIPEYLVDILLLKRLGENISPTFWGEEADVHGVVIK